MKGDTMDVRVENHGSLFLLRPTTPEAEAWLEENIADDAQTLGNATACEPRYVEAVVEGMQADGLVVA